MMGLMLPVFSIPVVSLALVLWAVVFGRCSVATRMASQVAIILLASATFTLVRTGGLSGDGDSDFHWRWVQTPEDKLLSQADEESAPLARTNAVTQTDAEWPGFRGPRRDGVVRGVRIETDWTKSPPKEMWRRDVGPGWSSFAVSGSRLYTQEQRGGQEIVSCYDLNTGRPIWKHHDRVRFWESNAGAGPRATPTLSNGQVFTCGATGLVNALDATDGSVLWSRNAATETEKTTPRWGFAGSPLLIDDAVVIATAGKLVALDRATGNRRWIGVANGGGYSSAHSLTIGGTRQILLLDGNGATSVSTGGEDLWKHSWDSEGIVQPALTEQGELLIGSAAGVRCIAVTRTDDGWSTQEHWTSSGIKPYFNDLVTHNGCAYGFDGSMLACIDLSDGQRRWKGGRYGHGQAILLADQDLLLVLSEKGDVALVRATPDQFVELGRIPAISGKTWNHPVLVGGVLLVRNDREMAAFRLKTMDPVKPPQSDKD
jgi:outer membrane protein assembly factor BamB